MPGSYTIVRYVPDPLRDEAINIGLIAYDGTSVHSKFLDNWSRVRRFGGEDIGYLRSFARTLEAAAPSRWNLASGSRVTPAIVADMAGSWVNSIQFTEPRATLLRPSEAVQQLAPRFLRGLEIEVPHRLTRHYARGLVLRVVRRAVQQVRGSDVRRIVHRDGELQGRHERHRLDAVVALERPLLAAHGLAFDLPKTVRVREALDAIKWAVDDVRQQDSTLPIGILTLAPTDPANHELYGLYDGANRVFSELGASVLSIDSVADWASSTVTQVLG